MFGSQKIWKKIQRKKKYKEKKRKKRLKVNKLFFCYFKLILFILIHQYKDK